MRYVGRIIFVSGLLLLSACSQAIPTVTSLSSSGQDNSKDTSVDSGGGIVTSSNGYKINGKIGGGQTTITSPNYRISVSGDN